MIYCAGQNMAGDWEEEYIVMVDLMGVNQLNLHSTDKLDVEMLGVASDKPVMLVNGIAFSGHFEDTIGTNVIMEVKQDENPESNTSSTQMKGLEFACKTDKKLVMERTFLFEKATVRERNQSSAQKAQDAAIASEAAGLQAQDDTMQHVNSGSGNLDHT